MFENENAETAAAQAEAKPEGAEQKVDVKPEGEQAAA
jgi:hypothetical protein